MEAIPFIASCATFYTHDSSFKADRSPFCLDRTANVPIFVLLLQYSRHLPGYSSSSLNWRRASRD